ncbi:putative quinol monooxygenase [Ponticaulis sp.]|uniref:putative quinol monooxygenase n=1 Tax=Ponticaulis sp. TaxID=2020902 RepID=UPI0025FAC6D6|nr:antibiotic biosynthesis monooxygenase family protein [Ponticaulis sp.]
MKPEYTDALIEAFLDVTPDSRGAPGNIRFDLYQAIEAPNTLVLFERWENVAAHEAHLAQDYNAPVSAVMADALEEPLSPATRILAVDASE